MIPSSGRMASPPPARPVQPAQSSTRPFVRQLGLQQVLDRDAPPPPEPQVLEEETWTALTGHVRRVWAINKMAKERIDQKLLQCLRARRGVYSANAMAHLQAAGITNFVWADITETKCRAASAWIRDIVLPTGQQPWGVDPTPMPDLPAVLKRSIVNRALQQAQGAMVQAAQAGAEPMDPGEFRDLVLQLGDKLRDEAEATYAKLAKQRAKRMEKTIADRLAEGHYAAAMDAFIEDFSTYPAALLKGPFYTPKKKLEWGEGWKPKAVSKPVQTWARVSPFDAYPAPGSQSPQQGDFIERIRFRRDELWDCKGLTGWQDDQIDQALRDYSEGHIENWLWTESERQRLEQETLYMWLSPQGVIDAISYWGCVPGWKLMSYGVPDLEETREYECNVVVCGRYVLYAALNPNPLSERPYRKACYDEIPGAFWGRSIPDLTATSQMMCNAIACAQASNLSIASGPQFWVHIDRLADGEQSLEQMPLKVWQLKSDPTQGVNPGIGSFQADDRSVPLSQLYDRWEVRADDATGIPRYTYGNERVGGAGDTFSGLTTLMQAAAKGLRRAISGIDLNVIGPTINDTFVNEMVYNPDPSIKGDNVTVPRGAAAVLIREAAQKHRLEFLQLTANPIDAQIITAKHRAVLLRETAAAMELPADEVVPSDEEIDAMQQAQAQAQQEQLQLQMAAEAKKMELEHQYEMEREGAIAQREQTSRRDEVLTKLVEQAVGNAMAAQQAAKSGDKKRISYKYNGEGELVGGEVE